MVDGDESDGEHEAEAESANAIPKGKLVAKPHQKRKCVRSQTQALSQVASSIGVFTESQNKRQKLQMEEEKKRDELFLKFKMDEAERNRQHELQMTRMMMEFMSGRMSMFISMSIIVTTTKLSKLAEFPNDKYGITYTLYTSYA